MKTWLEQNLGTAMSIGAVLGLAIPGLENIPSLTIPALTATLTYIACFKLEPTSTTQLSIARWLSFIAFRFAALPLLVFYFVNLFIPDLALGAFILTAVPAGVASPALVAIFGGSVSIALALVILTNILTPFLIPILLLATNYDSAVQIDLANVFVLLVMTIFTPLILFIVTKRIFFVRSFMNANGRALSILFVSAVILFAIGLRRDELFSSPQTIPLQFFLSLFIFFLLFASGWIFCRRDQLEVRITTSICSGCNNAALGISIALMYFPPRVAIFLVVSEIPWLIGPIAFRKFLQWNCSKLF